MTATRRPAPGPVLSLPALMAIEDSDRCLEAPGRRSTRRGRARLLSMAPRAALGSAPPPLRMDGPRPLLLRDPLRAGRAPELRRVRAAVGGDVRRLARHGGADRLAVVPRLRRLAAVRRPRGRPLRDPPHARDQH